VQIQSLFLDVTEINSVKNAINAVISEAERIDVVVNNAGYLLIRVLELIRQRSFMSRYDEKDRAENCFALTIHSLGHDNRPYHRRM
jgi:NAD(P)-dependent dehydrogenase (short-subunit alcohol dehydrogenase family)